MFVMITDGGPEPPTFRKPVGTVIVRLVFGANVVKASAAVGGLTACCICGANDVSDSVAVGTVTVTPAAGGWTKMFGSCLGCGIRYSGASRAGTIDADEVPLSVP